MSHFISLSTASAMTAKYRSNGESILKPEFQGQNLLPICETFDKASFETIISKDECANIRIYYGMSEDLKIHAIIVGANESGEDILPSSSLKMSEDGEILENGNRCPDLCPPPSPLNS